LIKKKKILTKKNVRKALVSDRYRAIDESIVKKTNNIFQDKEFCIITGNEKYDVKTLETKIIECGGTITKNPGNF
jgi:hypothetical protein